VKNEALELQQRLLDKIEEWYRSPAFGKGSTDKQKYVRAKGMLQATHPDVLTEVLGITSVPDVPLEAMNRIRTMDLSTLKKLEIFRGLDDKVVGHHMSAFGAISGALENQSPERRLELLNRAIDSGYRTGMDPKGIGPIRTSIHRPIAHQGDYSGKKPGYKVTPFSNTDDIEDIWTSLEASLKQQQGSFLDARNHQSTQDLISASKGTFGSDLITELDLPMDIRAEASKAADPIAKQMDNIITEFSGNDAKIQNNAKRLLETLPERQAASISKLGLKRNALRYGTAIPLAGAVIGFGQAGHAASQGDYAGAVAHSVGAVVGEVPIVGDVAVESVAGTAVADGTVTGRQQDVAARPSYYGKSGPDLSTPEQSNRAAVLRKDPTQERGYETIGRVINSGWNKLGQLRDKLLN